MSDLVSWIDGRILPAEDMALPLVSDATLRGISVFEGIKAYRTIGESRYCVISFLRHLTRLEHSCELMHLPVDSLADRVREAVSTLLAGETRDEVYLRPTVYLKSGYYGSNAETGLFVLARSAATDGGALRCNISTVHHIPPSAYPAQAKIGAMYAFFRLARLEAVRSGADEAILLTTNGKVAETPGASIFIVKDGVAHTPGLDSGILPSITRLTAIGLLRGRLAIETVEQDVSLEMLTSADEVFLTGTLDEVRGVSAINGLAVGRGPTPVTDALRTAYLVACRFGEPAPPPDSVWIAGGRRA